MKYREVTHHWFNMNWMRGEDKGWIEGELLLDFAGQPTKKVMASEEEEKDQRTAEVKEHIHYLQIWGRWYFVPSGLKMKLQPVLCGKVKSKDTWIQNDNVVRGR